MNEYIKNILVLFFITLAVALLLSVAHNLINNIPSVTNEKDQLTSAREQVISGLSYTKEEASQNVWTYYQTDEKQIETIVGFAVLVNGPGYGGDIELVVGLDSNYKVLGINILSHHETPGLGASAIKSLIPQFISKSGPFQISENPNQESEIQGITGATITTKAITDIVNNAIELAKVKSKG